MRSFTRHYIEGRPWSVSAASDGAGAAAAPPSAGQPEGVVCDEETIAAAIEASTARS